MTTDHRQLGRNDPCHCGSGKKYKKCHLAEDQAEQRREREAAAAEAAAAQGEEASSETEEAQSGASKQHSSEQPWKRSAQRDTRGFKGFTAPSRRGR